MNDTREMGGSIIKSVFAGLVCGTLEKKVPHLLKRNEGTIGTSDDS